MNKKLTGIVVSNKMKNTVVVRVERIKEHPKYRKRYKVHKKYKADTGETLYKEGDVVVIEETRPISKDKNWKVIEKINK